MTASVDRCGICGLEAPPVLLQVCQRCDVRFHLNPSAARAGIDCGDALLGPDPGVDYFCHPCLQAIHEETVESERREDAARGVERRPGWRRPS